MCVSDAAGVFECFIHLIKLRNMNRQCRDNIVCGMIVYIAFMDIQMTAKNVVGSTSLVMYSFLSPQQVHLIYSRYSNCVTRLVSFVK